MNLFFFGGRPDSLHSTFPRASSTFPRHPWLRVRNPHIPNRVCEHGAGKKCLKPARCHGRSLSRSGNQEARREAPSATADLTRTEGTVTKGAVNFMQIYANFANTMDLHPLLLPTNLANFAQIRQISHKFGKFRFFPQFLDLHPRLLHPRLFGSNPSASGESRPRHATPHFVR